MAKFGVPVRLLVFLLPILFALGCAGPDEINLTEVDNGKQVQMMEGKTLVVSLPSNPTTGYGWEIAELNEQILASAGEPEYIASDGELVGSGGIQRFRFECVGEGQGTIKLVYRRPWETEDPLEIFQINVVTTK